MIRRLLVAFALISLPAAAQQADVDAAARSVVRVMVVEEGSDDGAGVGMGSGVAVTPTRIVTNAHVVEAAVERGGVVGIIPSEGRTRYVGEVVAYSPALDLAIVAIKGGRMEPATLYGDSVADGAGVVALGYPFAVDRAMAAGLADLIRPQSPIKSNGTVGGRRSNARFDTVLHTANIGRGNSGGPLIDACGRVVGINSFLSVSEGIDSTFAFALSIRALLPFLAAAKVTPKVVTTPCLSSDETRARAEALARSEADSAATQARQVAREASRAATEKQQLRDTIAGERDDGLALAGALLVLGALGVGGAIALIATQRPRIGWVSAATGGTLMFAAVVVFFARPTLSEAEDRYAALHPVGNVATIDATADDGPRQCVPNPARSIVKLSASEPVRLDWRSDGCVNGRTQYGSNAGTWSRTFVPSGEATVTIQTFDPARSRYTVERFLMSADAMKVARTVRARYTNSVCTTDPVARRSVSEMETAIRETLPPIPHEKLVFDCQAATEPAG